MACRDTITDQQIVDKILRTLPQRFDHVVVAIEETKDLEEMEVKDLQHFLEGHEFKINERRHKLKNILSNPVLSKVEKAANQKGRNLLIIKARGEKK